MMRLAIPLLCVLLAGCGPSKEEQERAEAAKNLQAAEEAYTAAQKEYDRLAKDLGQAELAVPQEKDQAKQQELKVRAVEIEDQLKAQKEAVEQAINRRVKAQDKVNALAE